MQMIKTSDPSQVNVCFIAAHVQATLPLLWVFPVAHPQGAFSLWNSEFKTGSDSPLICFYRAGRLDLTEEKFGLEHRAGILPLSLTVPPTSPLPCSRTTWVPKDCSGVHFGCQLLGTNRKLSHRSPVHPRDAVPGPLTKASPN